MELTIYYCFITCIICFDSYIEGVVVCTKRIAADTIVSAVFIANTGLEKQKRLAMLLG